MPRTPLALAFVVLALVSATTSCTHTDVMAAGIEPEMAAIEAVANRPIVHGIEHVTMWPHPALLAEGARRLPSAALAVAYDAPMALAAETWQLASYAYGGEDLVHESTYRTWKEWEDVDRANPLPSFVPADGGLEAAVATDEAAPRTATGWTASRQPVPVPENVFRR